MAELAIELGYHIRAVESINIEQEGARAGITCAVMRASEVALRTVAVDSVSQLKANVLSNAFRPTQRRFGRVRPSVILGHMGQLMSKDRLQVIRNACQIHGVEPDFCRTERQAARPPFVCGL